MFKKRNEKNVHKKITSDDVKRATQILSEYKQGKTNLEKRIVENEKWWKMQHWDLVRNKENASDIEPASAWLFNSVANKHADAMESYPEPTVLPRERSDEEGARMMSAILPVVLERNDFEKIYSDVWWYKLKTGTGCYGVFWNNRLENGRGDIDIKQIDILNFFWEPGIKDIQKSRNIFTVELVDNDVILSNYPFLKGKLGGNTIDVARYLYDATVDTTEKSAVVDWYYKVRQGNKEMVHFCKFVNNHILYASENDPYYVQRGYYDHGMYPFVFDVLYVEEGTPCGFGYIDIMKDVQLYIDKLNQIIIKNAMQAGKRRFFISDNTGINEEEFADWSREFVHVAGNIDERNLREITISQLDSGIIGLLNQKISELKEISGNRDVSTGSSANGVTAASAIAALQEAGSKLSRDMISASYRAFRHLNYLIIELIRQFYDDERCFRITGEDGRAEFINFTSNMIANPDASHGRPVFDIEVVSQKKSLFSKTAQNELAKELYAAGIFDPKNAQQALACLEIMDFEGKNLVVERVRKNLEEHTQIEMMQEEMKKMAELIEYAYGTKKADNKKGIIEKTNDGIKKAYDSQLLGRERLEGINSIVAGL